MEGAALSRRLPRRGGAIRRLPAALVTSGRRCRERGVIKTWLHHTLLITLYLAGVSPRRLARLRRAAPSPPPPPAPPPPPQARSPRREGAGARDFPQSPDAPSGEDGSGPRQRATRRGRRGPA